MERNDDVVWCRCRVHCRVLLREELSCRRQRQVLKNEASFPLPSCLNKERAEQDSVTANFLFPRLSTFTFQFTTYGLMLLLLLPFLSFFRSQHRAYNKSLPTHHGEPRSIIRSESKALPSCRNMKQADKTRWHLLLLLPCALEQRRLLKLGKAPGLPRLEST